MLQKVMNLTYTHFFDIHLQFDLPFWQSIRRGLLHNFLAASFSSLPPSGSFALYWLSSERSSALKFYSCAERYVYLKNTDGLNVKSHLVIDGKFFKLDHPNLDLKLALFYVAHFYIYFSLVVFAISMSSSAGTLVSFCCGITRAHKMPPHQRTTTFSNFRDF